MENSKVWYKSSTLQGQIVTVLGLLIRVFNLPIIGDEAGAIVGSIFILVGVVYSVWGRVKSNGEKILLK